MKEFVENSHFTKQEKHTKRYYEYLRNNYQSKAFQGGSLCGFSAVFVFLKRSKSFSPLYKCFYSVNLFLSTYIFVYEIWSKYYTDKNKLYIIDNKLLSMEIP